MSYTIIEKTGYLNIDWHGIFTPDDLVELRKEITTRAKLMGYAPNVVHTFDKLVPSPVKPLVVLDHSIQRKATHLANPAKSALVAKTEDIKQVVALFVALNRNPNLVMRIFTSDEAAIGWVLSSCLPVDKDEFLGVVKK